MKKASRIVMSALLSFPMLGWSAEIQNSNLGYDLRRGSPAQYDPGAPKGSEWAQLFGSTPNYRSYGKQILGGYEEKFRWEFGPMWYRGRLGTNQVKAFVVGQEGAQDENVTNRAFTGSTGTKTQNFLNHLGIYSSYLFLNTFVYTINGQLEQGNKKFTWLEQGVDSPIVEYRHKLFDNMIKENKDTIALIIGVGSGGKASVATWINARGGNCSAVDELKNCDTSGMVQYFNKKGIALKGPILAVGVPHPGGANPNLGGADQLEKIIGGFTNAAKKVAAFKLNNLNWLPVDADEKASPEDYILRLESKYIYKNAPVPFRDFAFGTNWRMGARGTSSNRWGSDSIQIFSNKGEYAAKPQGYTKPYDAKAEEFAGYKIVGEKIVGLAGMLQDQIVGAQPEYDLPYESPRYAASQPEHMNMYDYGPCGLQTFTKHADEPCSIAMKLTAWPNFATTEGLSSVSDMSFGFAGTYRGRLNDAQLLILADQESQDDMFSARAITGSTGQKLQRLIDLSNVGSSYGILRTLPVDTLGMSDSEIQKMVRHPLIKKVHKDLVLEVLSKNKTKNILVMGVGAEVMIEELIKEGALEAYSDVKIQKLESTSSLNYINQWNNVALQAGLVMSKSFDGKMNLIPRIDLPYSSRWWMGSSGSRAARPDNETVKGHYYRVFSPYWQTRISEKPLSESQKVDLQNKMQLNNLF